MSGAGDLEVNNGVLTSDGGNIAEKPAWTVEATICEDAVWSVFGNLNSGGNGAMTGGTATVSAIDCATLAVSKHITVSPDLSLILDSWGRINSDTVAFLPMAVWTALVTFVGMGLILRSADAGDRWLNEDRQDEVRVSVRLDGHRDRRCSD